MKKWHYKWISLWIVGAIYDVVWIWNLPKKVWDYDGRNRGRNYDGEGWNENQTQIRNMLMQKIQIIDLGSFSASVAAGSLAWKLIDPKMFVMGSAPAPVSIQIQSATLCMC